MTTFKVYFEALKNPDIVKGFGRPRIEGKLMLSPSEVRVDKSIITNLALRDYNHEQIKAMIKYIKRYTKYNTDKGAGERLVYLMTTYPKEMGVKMKLYLASLKPNSFDDVAVL